VGVINYCPDEFAGAVSGAGVLGIAAFFIMCLSGLIARNVCAIFGGFGWQGL
jgi:hypothetical protein